jgi:uncharacterized protein (TIGR00251 family)
MEFYSCLQKTLDGGVLIDIEVQPASKRTGITGFNDWRNRLSIAVMAQAKDGKANEALVYVLSNIFEVEKTSIEIVSGHTSRMKKVRITGKGATQIAEFIKLELGD